VGGYNYDPATGTNIYNPFHHQVPVVVENTGQGGMEKVEDHSMLTYEVKADQVRGDIDDFPYSKIKVRQYDQNGKLVFSRE